MDNEARAAGLIREKITTINLERMWWFTLVVTALSASYLIYNVFWWKHAEGFWVQAGDLILSAFFIALIWKVRAMPQGSRWRSLAVWSYLLLMIIVMDVYYFAALPVVGHTACYVVGVLTTGVLLLLPSRVFLPVLLLNHAVYCVWLWTVRGAEQSVVPLLDGTAGVLIAAMASRFLYTTTKSNLSKELVIEARNTELAETNAELVTLNEEMNDLMAIAAHDLRSPLQGQKNLLELLQTRSNLGAEKTKLIMDTAIADCGSMLGLVSRLLEAHQAENQGGDMILEAHDLRDPARAALARAGRRATEKDIRLEGVMPDGPVTARISPQAVEEVLDNLIGNALKFSPAGSAVRLEVREGPEIAVQDEGPGIPPGEEELLYRKFHRGINRPTAGEPSTGMGLFIVKKLMEAMGGSVSHRSTGEKGTVFRLRFGRA